MKLLTRRFLFRSVSLSLGVWMLTACGFQMRQTPDFVFKTIYVGFNANSNLGEEFKRALQMQGDVRLITDNRQLDAAQVILDVLTDQREKSVVGANVSGQVREFQLRLRFKYRLRTLAGKELIPETELLLQRDITYNETAALSKEAEENLLYRNMQSDIVQQTLRRLSVLRSL